MRTSLKYDLVNGRLRITMHVGTFTKSSLGQLNFLAVDRPYLQTQSVWCKRLKASLKQMKSEQGRVTEVVCKKGHTGGGDSWEVVDLNT